MRSVDTKKHIFFSQSQDDKQCLCIPHLKAMKLSRLHSSDYITNVCKNVYEAMWFQASQECSYSWQLW